MQLVHLALKGARHHSLTQPLDAVHLGFHQASPVIANPSFPDISPQPSACGDRYIPMRKRLAFVFEHSCEAGIKSKLLQIKRRISELPPPNDRVEVEAKTLLRYLF